VVTGDDRRCPRGRRWSQRDQGGVPLRWVAVEVAGEHLIGGDVGGGGRRFGRGRNSPERARKMKLERGIDDIVWERSSGRVSAVEVEYRRHGDRGWLRRVGDRRRGRRPSRGQVSGLAVDWEVGWMVDVANGARGVLFIGGRA
jgi:hypothetical protein